MIRWYLEGLLETENTKTRLPLANLPQVLGRDEKLQCIVSAPSVSRAHARIGDNQGVLWIEDMDSRNGTFVNHHRISEREPIEHGDVIHLGTTELRLIDTQHHGSLDTAKESLSNETCFISQAQLSQNFPCGVKALEHLLANKQVKMVYQTVVAADLTTYGYEVLGRGDREDLPASPLELFRIAESIGMEVELSEVMRDCGTALAVQHRLPGQLLVNTHPSEMKEPERLLRSLSELRQRFPDQALTLEIHEQSVTGNSDLLTSLKKELDSLAMDLAFDDFGVGQSRLMELVEAKPKLIKFDRVLIDGIDRADASRINLLQHLKDLASELDIFTLAECVSNEGEYLVCKSMNFDFYQGFYFAKPQAPENLF